MKKKLLYILPIVFVAVIAVLISYFTTIKGYNKRNSINIQLEKAEKYYEDNDIQKALSAYAGVISKDSQKLTAYEGKAKAYIAIKQYHNAADTLETAMDIIKQCSNKNSSILNGAEGIIKLYAEVLHENGETEKEYDSIVYGNTIFSGLFKDYYNTDYIPADENNNVQLLDSSCKIDEDGNIIAGWFPQSEIKGDALTNQIKYAGYNSKENTYIDGKLYKRELINNEYHYFIYEPIKWQILKSDENNYTLMTVNTIDKRNYNEELTEIDWDNCSLRKWLNNDFISEAFADDLSSKLTEMNVIPSVNRYYPNTAGTNVKDLVTIIQVNSITDNVYGFADTIEKPSKARESEPTEYASAKGVLSDSYGRCKYWLNSVGQTNEKAGYINNDGVIGVIGLFVNSDDVGIRPLICLSKEALPK